MLFILLPAISVILFAEIDEAGIVIAPISSFTIVYVPILIDPDCPDANDNSLLTPPIIIVDVGLPSTDSEYVVVAVIVSPAFAKDVLALLEEKCHRRNSWCCPHLH